MFSIDLPNIASVQAIPDICDGQMSEWLSLFRYSPSKYYFVRGKSILKPKRNYAPGIRRYIDENRPTIL